MIHQHMTSRVRGHDSSVARGQGQKGEFPDCEARMIPARRMGEEGAELILQTWPFTDNLMPARDASQRKGWHRLQDREREGKGHDIVALLCQKRSPHSRRVFTEPSTLPDWARHWVSLTQVHRGLQDLPRASGHELNLQWDEMPQDSRAEGCGRVMKSKLLAAGHGHGVRFGVQSCSQSWLLCRPALRP